MEHGQRGSKAGILHTYLDGNGFGFGNIHMAGLGQQKADAVAQQVMAHDNQHDEESGFHDALGADSYHAAKDEDNGQNGNNGKDFDNFLNLRFKQAVQDDAQDNGQDYYLKDGDHHGCQGNIDPRTCQTPGKQGVTIGARMVVVMVTPP